jgi:hypothetical protein
MTRKSKRCLTITFAFPAGFLKSCRLFRLQYRCRCWRTSWRSREATILICQGTWRNRLRSNRSSFSNTSFFVIKKLHGECFKSHTRRGKAKKIEDRSRIVVFRCQWHVEKDKKRKVVNDIITSGRFSFTSRKRDTLSAKP